MRLIDAEALKKALSEPLYRSTIKDFGEVLEYTHIMNTIDNAPTIKTFTLADIEEQYRKGLEKGLSEWETERPQGEWIIDVEDGINTMVTCPFCKERHCCKMNFCGNCGAAMRGKEDETD